MSVRANGSKALADKNTGLPRERETSLLSHGAYPRRYRWQQARLKLREALKQNCIIGRRH